MTMTHLQIEAYLSCVHRRPPEPTPEAIRAGVADLKRDAVSRHDESGAKRAWCLETALSTQDLYLGAFTLMKEGKFYDAWCDLERAEVALNFLKPHGGLWSLCRLDFIQRYIGKWQALFPYKLFLSPEFLVLEKVCSICETRLTPRRRCEHIAGEIYGGEVCCDRLTKMELLGASMVTSPVQKYSVAFLTDPATGKQRDHYNYALVRYAVGALRGPFDEWDAVWTKRRQPHSYFRDMGRSDPCPCESGRKYEECCLEQEGVLRPHVEFRFAIPPPDGTVAGGFTG